MASQIRPSRLEVNDRFPVLGFTIRTGGDRANYELAVAADPALFRPESKARRNRSNFYSTRSRGPLPVAGGEAVHLLAPEVLARFVGKEKLYFAVATLEPGPNGKLEVAALPSEGSPYVSLKGLTGRSLQRIRLLPSRQQARAGYSDGTGAELEWAGDAAVPGSQPVASNGASQPANGATSRGPNRSGAPAEPTEYNDGFGPLGPANSDAAPPDAAAAQSLATFMLGEGEPTAANRAANGYATELSPAQIEIVAKADRFGLADLARALLAGGDVAPELGELLHRLLAEVEGGRGGNAPPVLLQPLAEAQVEPITIASFAVASFSLINTLAKQLSGDLSWSRNITRAVHEYPPGVTPNIWWEQTREILGVDAQSGASGAWVKFELVWRCNGNDIDQCRVECNSSSDWEVSSLEVSFEGSDASSYERDGVACIAVYIRGSFNPLGSGDVDFEGHVLARADGTLERRNLRITRGDTDDVRVLNGSLTRPEYIDLLGNKLLLWRNDPDGNGFVLKKV